MNALSRSDQIKKLVQDKMSGMNGITPQVSQVVQLLTIIDRSMEYEQIDNMTRDRVINRCIFGIPDPQNNRFN